MFAAEQRTRWSTGDNSGHTERGAAACAPGNSRGCEWEEPNDGDLDTRSELLSITEDGEECAARRPGLRRNPEPRWEQQARRASRPGCNPGSGTYRQVVGRLDLPNNGDELHHFGWNACSAAL